MLLGIKLSNLTRDQKILKAKKFFLPNFAEYLSSSTRQKKICRVSSEGTRQTTPFAECQVVALGKHLTPSAPLTGGARRARVLGTCAGFAECRRASTRQMGQFAECHSLPTAGTRQSSGMPCGRCLPSARGVALSKPHLCRVPVFWHSLKAETLGKFGFSGSESCAQN